MEFRAEHGRPVATKAAQRDPVDGVYGILKLDRPADELMKALRGTADTV